MGTCAVVRGIAWVLIFGGKNPLEIDGHFFGSNAEIIFLRLKHESSPLSVSKKYQRLYAKSSRFEWYHSLDPSLLWIKKTFKEQRSCERPNKHLR